MWNGSYFGARYWNGRYWAKVGATLQLISVDLGDLEIARTVTVSLDIAQTVTTTLRLY